MEEEKINTLNMPNAREIDRERIEAIISRETMKNFKIGDLKEIDGMYFKVVDVKQLKKRLVLEHVIVQKKVEVNKTEETKVEEKKEESVNNG